MQSYNTQQQAVIIKGIAQQLISMNVPTFDELNKLISQFNISENTGNYTGQEVYRALTACLITLNGIERIDGKTNEEKCHTILHHTLNSKSAVEVASKLHEPETL